MVGRPRTKAKHVETLAEQQYALNDRLFAECPPMYLDGLERRDPLAQSWRSAIEAVAAAWHAIDDLREVLAAKVEAAERRNDPPLVHNRESDPRVRAKQSTMQC